MSTTRHSLIPAGFVLRDENGTFMDHIGPIYVRKNECGIELCLVVEKRHTNPVGTTHGGLLMSLMDVTLGASAGQLLGHDGVVATVQLSCNLIAAAREGELVVTAASVDRVTRTLSFVTGRVTCGDRVLLTGSGVFRNPPTVASSAS